MFKYALKKASNIALCLSIQRRNWVQTLSDEIWISKAAKVRSRCVRLDIQKCLTVFYLWAADINGKLGTQVWSMELSK